MLSLLVSFNTGTRSSTEKSGRSCCLVFLTINMHIFNSKIKIDNLTVSKSQLWPLQHHRKQGHDFSPHSFPPNYVFQWKWSPRNLLPQERKHANLVGVLKEMLSCWQNYHESHDIMYNMYLLWNKHKQRSCTKNKTKTRGRCHDRISTRM